MRLLIIILQNIILILLLYKINVYNKSLHCRDKKLKFRVTYFDGRIFATTTNPDDPDTYSYSSNSFDFILCFLIINFVK